MRHLLTALALIVGLASPASAQIANNLVAYYPMDEASGDAIDVKNGHTGTETSGTIDAVAGRIGGARDFELADTEYFSVADNADFDMGTGDWSISVWTNAESAVTARIVSKMDTSTPFTGYGILRNSSAAIQVQTSDGTLATVTANTTTGSVFRHVVVTRSGTTILVYIQGVLTNTLAGQAGSLDNAEPLLIGAFNATTPSAQWDGIIDELGIWKGRALTATEVTWLYNAGNGRSYADVVSEGSGGTKNLLLMGVGE